MIGSTSMRVTRSAPTRCAHHSNCSWRVDVSGVRWVRSRFAVGGERQEYIDEPERSAAVYRSRPRSKIPFHAIHELWSRVAPTVGQGTVAIPERDLGPFAQCPSVSIIPAEYRSPVADP